MPDSNGPRRKRWVIGNFSQHLLRTQAEEHVTELIRGLPPEVLDADELRIGVAPSFLALETCRPWARPAGPLVLLAQNASGVETGPFTGEIGPGMLADVGAHGALIGHWHRRVHFRESNTQIASKLQGLLEAGMHVALCVGDPPETRESRNHENHVISQLSTAFLNVDPAFVCGRLVIVYQPVWALAHDRPTRPEQAAHMHRRIRSWMGERFGDAGRGRSILHGGTVGPDQIGALLGSGEVDGFLLEAPSLDVSAFLDIVRAMAPARP